MTEPTIAPSPASSLQRQFWLLQRATPESTAYHVCALFHVEGDLDVEALRRAMADVVRSHAALHTCLVQEGAQLLQVARPEVPPSFDVETEAIEPGSARVAEEHARPFDLARGPLFRARIWPARGGGHLIAWTMHHAICDLATKDRITAEISERYAALRAGESATLPTSVPYREFAAWEAGYLAGEGAARDAAYFATHLGPSVTPLALPEDHPRPAIQSARGACEWFDLPEAIVRGLEEASRELATKPFLLLLSAYAALLGRYAAQERVVVGVPFTNRRRPESRETVGCFVNNLPLAIDLSGPVTFPELLRRVRAGMLEHHRHQELPLERIVSAYRARDASRNPVFQAGFTFEPPPTLSLAGARVRSLDAHGGGAQLDVFLTMWPDDGGFRGRLEYCRDLFGAESVRTMVRSYLTLLEGALSPAAREVPISRLPLLAAPDRERVLRGLNQTDRAFDGPPVLTEAFTQQALRTPDAVAVSMGDETITYRELLSRTSAMARRLRAEGVQTGGRVGLYMVRSIEMVVAIWGVMLAGAAYVPIDPEFPSARVAQVLEDAAPVCILTHAAVASRLDAGAVPVRVLSPGAPADGDDAAALPRVTPDHAAYVIFTSGSTGRPKGVENTHAGIRNRIFWMHEAYALRVDDVVLQKTPYTFDVSTWEFMWPLVVGARLEVAPPDAHRDPAALAALIQRARVTTIHFVPSMLHAFLAHPAAKECASLERVVCSGEALGAALVKRCAAALTARIYNLYGPTEAAVDVTEWRCHDDLSRDPVPIGKPIANTRLYVLDAHREPVPRGVLGELYIGGVQVARGYVNRPELTAERFVPDPFSSDPAARLYRTGDLTRHAPDGNILFEGRTDHQVKVRGNRIELGEIEAVLDQHAAVLQSVATVRALSAADAQIVAYVVPRDGGAERGALAESVRAHLTARLPAAMIPQHVVVLDAMPLTSSGKVDRKLLPDPAPTTRSAAAPVPPRDDLDRWLVAQFQDLLGGATVFGIHENIFELGATSLMCAELIGRIREHLSRDVPLARVFEHPTVAGLAAHLASLEGPSATQSDELARAKERAARQRGARPPRRG